ncbi:MAG: cation transporter [Candidatus Latescibacterota bacterium]
MDDRLHKKALFLSYFTVGYNIAEGIISIIAGTIAGSIALTGFGLDSFVESLSGSVMIWRLRKHGHTSEDEEEHKEKRALKLIAWSFFILGAYVFYEAVRKLYLREIPDPSLLGIIITLVSLITMPILYFQKYRTGKAMGLRSLVADSKETLACTLLSFSVLIGLCMNAVWGLWWADPAAGLIIVYFLVKEGREAFED